MVLIVTVLCTTFVCLATSNADIIDNSRFFWTTWQNSGPCNCAAGTQSRHRTCNEIELGSGVIRQSNPIACSGSSTSSTKCSCTHVTSTGTCHDVISSCEIYNKTSSVCRQYVSWSQSNCKKFCGFCNSVPTIPIVPTIPAPVNGGWSTWSSSSTCSVTCGQGHKTLTRTCTHPAPAHGGHRCSGLSSIAQVCYYPSCATLPPSINGNWGAWHQYNSCTQTCGGGIHTRYRYCNNPTPSGGGNLCTGAPFQQAPCNTQSCIIDGGWGGWTTWTACSKSCDLGTITRHRTCNQPAPSVGGAPCSGGSKDTHECSMGPCPEWSHWYHGDCSVTCGNGTMDRLRHCSTGRDSDCTGMATELVPCMEVACFN